MPKVFKRWIYHKTKAPKIINSDEFESMAATGWADSPAKFINLADFNVDPANDSEVHQLGETIEGVKNAANGALNIDTMGKKELEKYAKKYFGIDIDRRNGIKTLRKEVKEMAGA
jgi:hypothetical protein